METPHLDKTIEQLKGLAERVPVKEVTEKLQEYKAIKEALSIHSVSHFSEIYVTFDEDDGSVGTAFDNKERAERDAVETCSGLMTMRLIHGK